MRRSKFENLENKIVLEIDYSKAKGNLRKLIVLCASQLQRKHPVASQQAMEEYLRGDKS